MVKSRRDEARVLRLAGVYAPPRRKRRWRPSPRMRGAVFTALVGLSLAAATTALALTLVASGG